jgi:BTB/POZ domain-containing protein KCTD9
VIININKLKLFTYSIFLILFLSSCSEPIEKINAGKDCKKCNLSNADLSGLTLNGIDLTGADLSGANLSNTKILGVNFTDAILKDTDLSNSMIDMYDDGSKVVIGLNPEHQTTFVNSDLSDANLQNATASFTIFLNSNLTNANLRNLETSYTKFENVNFTNSNLRNLETSYTKFINVNFTNSILENFDFDDAEIINPIIPISNNPMDSIAEANTLVAKSKKSNLAERMFFSDYAGMISTIAEPERYNSHISAILKSFNVFDIVQENGNDHQFFGTNQEIGYDTIRANYDDYRPTPIRYFICDVFDEIKSEKELPNIDQYDLQDQDKELYKMIIDDAEYRKCYHTLGNYMYSDSPQTTLEDFLYDHFINLIEASKISECPYVESSIKLFPAPRRDGVNTPKSALIIVSNLQTASRYNKEVTAYNECVSEAYQLVKSGINSITESAIRVTHALNEPLYMEKVSKDLAAQKREEETEKYKSKIYELTRKLYTFEDLVYPLYEDAAFEVAIEKRGLDKIIMTGGLDAEEIESIKEGRKNIFRYTMTNCLSYSWSSERNTKKRKSIIERLTKAAENNHSDEEISKRIRECAYDANIAYLTR